MTLTEQALETAHELYDAGNRAAAIKATRLAIKAAGTDLYWLREAGRHLRWFAAGLRP